jgi:hypothetical protein
MYSKLLNIFRFNKVFWWVVCFLLISNIIFFLTVSGNQKTRINELQSRYNVERISKLVKTDNSQDLYIKAKDDIEFFKGKLAEKKDFGETAAELFAIFKKNQIEPGQTVYKPESVDMKGLFKYTTSLSIKGSYPALKAALAEIQGSRTLFCIENLSISGSPADNSVEMKIKIAAYFR